MSILSSGDVEKVPSGAQTPQALWPLMRGEAESFAEASPQAAALMRRAILDHKDFGEALVVLLARKLTDALMSEESFACLLGDVLAKNPEIAAAAARDTAAVYERDPACNKLLMPLIWFKGFQAISAYRFAHALWRLGDEALALNIQSRISEFAGVDIHPAAKIGSGIMADHATGIVIGETAVVGDNVSMLHGVTLGGTGHVSGDRHPKIGDDVLLGANASIIGNIEIGPGARIAAGSVVLQHVPAGRTAAGVPARLVGLGSR